jgi:hypothetical protein
MTNRSFLKCDVCGAVTLMRLQVGWLEEHPIRVPCGKCGILISGTIHIDQVNPGLRYEIHNASEIQETVPDFYVEASGELLAEKLKRYKGGPFFWSPPPFFQALWAMGNDNYTEFKGKALQFLAFTKTEWPKVRRINELWLGKQYQYLPDEVARYLPKDKFPMTNEAEYVRGVHQLNLLFLWAVLDHSRFEKQTKFLFRTLQSLSSHHGKGFAELLKYFADQDLLQKYGEQLHGRMAHFVDRFRYLLPAFALRFYQKRPKGLNKQKGVTTATFEDVKSFYADSYEVFTEMLPLVVAYNNLRYRGDFKLMRNKRKDVVTLDDFIVRSKGERLAFVDGSEMFDRLLYPHLDNKLRNATAHTSYKEDLMQQRITYYPAGVMGKGQSKKVYLIDVLRRCWSLFYCIVDMMELHYQTQKLYYVVVLRNKVVHPSVFRNWR